MKRKTNEWIRKFSAILLSVSMSLTFLPQVSSPAAAEESEPAEVQDNSEQQNEENVQSESTPVVENQTIEAQNEPTPETEYVNVTFNFPEGAFITVKNATTGDVVGSQDGSATSAEFCLYIGTVYSYTVSKEGYETVTVNNFEPNAAVTSVDVTLVSNAPQLSITDITLGVGKTSEAITITNKKDDHTYKWESTNEAVAVHTEDEKIKAVSEGTTTITVTDEQNGASSTINVTCVVLPEVSVDFNVDKSNLDGNTIYFNNDSVKDVEGKKLIATITVKDPNLDPANTVITGIPEAVENEVVVSDWAAVEGQANTYKKTVEMIKDNAYSFNPVVTDINSQSNDDYTVSKVSSDKISKSTVITVIKDTAVGGIITDNSNTWSALASGALTNTYAKNYTVTATGSDDLSGIKKAEYYKDDNPSAYLSESELASKTWTQITDGKILTNSEDSNYVVYAKITEKAGNVGYVSTSVLVTDNTAPTVTFTSEGELSKLIKQDENDPASWKFTTKITGIIYQVIVNKTNGEVTGKIVDNKYAVSINVSDEQSGVKEWSYYLINKNDGTTITPEGILEIANNPESVWTSITDTQTTVNAIPDTDVVLVKAIDKVGNTTITCSNGIAVDTVAPEVSVDFNVEKSNLDGNTIYFNNDSVKDVEGKKLIATITVSDKNFDTSSTVTGIDENLKVSNWTDNKDGTYTATVEIPNEGFYTFAPVVTDKAGNSNTEFTLSKVGPNKISTTTPVTVVKDITAPTGTISDGTITWNTLASKDLTYKYSDKYTLTATSDDGTGSGVKEVKYCQVENPDSYLDVDALASKKDWTDTLNELTGNSNYVVYEKITDKAGNIGYVSTYVLVTDNTPPKVSVSFNVDNSAKDGNTIYFGKKEIGEKTLTATITVKETNFDASSTDNISGIDSSLIGTWSKVEGKDDTYEMIIELPKDGSYTFVPVVTDKKGNANTEFGVGSETIITPDSITVIEDTKAPTGTITDNNGNSWEKTLASGNLLYNYAKDFILTATGLEEEEVKSGIKEVDYYIVEGTDSYLDSDALAKDGISWTAPITDDKTSIQTGSLAGDTAYVVYAKITDKAGNIGYISTNVLVTDNTVPKVTFTNVDLFDQLQLKDESGTPVWQLTKEITDAIFTVIGNTTDTNIYKDGEYSVDIDVNDNEKDESDKTVSGVKEWSYCLVNSTGTEINNDSIRDYANNETSWIPITDSEGKLITSTTVKAIANADLVLVKAKDKVGNETVYCSNGVVIDTVSPTVDLAFSEASTTEDIEGGKKFYYNTNPTITYTVTERNFVLGNVKLNINGTEYALDSLPKGFSYKYDAFKNDSQNGNAISALTDKRTNTITVEIEEEGDYVIVPVVTDDSGNANENFTINNGLEISTTSEVVYETKAPTGTITDNNGNSWYDELASGDLTYKYANTYTATIEGSEKAEEAVKSGIKEVGYYIEQSDSLSSYLDKGDLEGKTITWTTDKTSITTSKLDGDTDYVVYAKITDKSGNVGFISTNVLRTDNILPKVSVDFNVEKSNLIDQTIYFNKETIGDKTLTATITVEEKNFDTDDKKNAITINGIDSKDISDWTGKDGVYTKTVKIDNDGSYDFYPIVIDRAGNKNEIFTCSKVGGDNELNSKVTVIKDTVAPVVTITATPDKGSSSKTSWDTEEDTDWDTTNTNEYIRKVAQSYKDGLSSNKFTVSIDKNDDGSGIESTNYQTVSYTGEDAVYADKGWTSYEKEFDIVANNTEVAFARVEDKAKNVTIINTAVLIADTVSPTATLYEEAVDRNANGFYKDGNVILEVQNITDPTENETNDTWSGVMSATYTITNDKEEKNVITGDNPINITDRFNPVHKEKNEECSKQTGIITIEVPATGSVSAYDSNYIKVHVTLTDYAGNTTVLNSDFIKIDTTKPVITLDPSDTQAGGSNIGVNNSSYFTGSKTVTITVQERNFDQSQTWWTVTSDHKNQPSASGWKEITTTGDTSNETKWQNTLTFTADDDYVINVKNTDLAGNTAEGVTSKRFTIDNTAPVMSVSFNNNDVRNGKYYKAGRTATITIVEHNFDSKDVSATVNGSLLSGWSTSGDTHTATIACNSDGTYSFNISYKDLAGNASNSISESEFVIDLTAPVVSFFDIVNHSANNGEVAPGVQYTDTNYSTSDVSITMTGYKHGAKNVSGVQSAIANGQSIKMSDFEHVADVDDVYTITATITDLAGNATTETITFSVNRFGSNFIATDATQSAVFKPYYINEEKVVAIEEIGVDSITSYDISVSRDGDVTQLDKKSDYTTKASGTEDTWKTNLYTMNASNFTEEGLYDITISSVDAAGNSINNKIKNTDFNFVVDKTAPSVVLTGVADDGRYSTDSQDMVLKVSDNISMGEVQLFVGENSESQEVAQRYTAKDISDLDGSLPYTLSGSNNWQYISVVAVDAAGNETKEVVSMTEDGQTLSSSSVKVLVTSSVVTQLLNNTIFKIGFFILILLLAIIIYYMKRRKDKATQK